MKSKESKLFRIKEILEYYRERGYNSERVNRVYRNVITKRL